MGSAGILSAPGVSPSLVYRGFYTDTAENSTDRTFSSVPLGGPSANRIVLAFLYQSLNITSPAVGDCTLGGTDASRTGFGSQSTGCSVSFFAWDNYSAAVTAADLVFSPFGTTNGVGLALFTIDRAFFPASTQEFVFDPNTAGANTDDLDMSIEDNGVIFGAMFSRSGTATGQLGGFDNTLTDEYVSANSYYAWVGWEKTLETDANKIYTMDGYGNSWVGFSQAFGAE